MSVKTLYNRVQFAMSEVSEKKTPVMLLPQEAEQVLQLLHTLVQKEELSTKIKAL